MPDLPLGPFGAVTVVVSLVFLFAGVAMPQAAAALLRLMLVTLAVALVLTRIYEATRPARGTEESFSPFDAYDPIPVRPAAPQALRELTRRLEAADDPKTAPRMAIPAGVERTVMEEASRRLAEHRGLRLDDPRDGATIRSLVSAPTWSLLDRDPDAAGASRRSRRRRPPRLSQLALILDDLERL